MGWSHEAAVALVKVADGALDPILCASISRALQRTADPLAIPTLINFSSHQDAEVRLQVAMSLPFCVEWQTHHAGVAHTMLELSRDVDPNVRNWATFGLGSSLDEDSIEIRDAFVAALDDTDRATRLEAVIGLARRRDPRVLPTLESILSDCAVGDFLVESNDYEVILVFDSARYLSDPRLLPFLDAIVVDDEFIHALVHEAKTCCDPTEANTVHSLLSTFAAMLQDRLDNLQSDFVVSLFCDRFNFPSAVQLQLLSSVDLNDVWDFKQLLERSQGSVQLAVESVVEDVGGMSPNKWGGEH